MIEVPITGKDHGNNDKGESDGTWEMKWKPGYVWASVVVAPFEGSTYMGISRNRLYCGPLWRGSYFHLGLYAFPDLGNSNVILIPNPKRRCNNRRARDHSFRSCVTQTRPRIRNPKPKTLRTLI